MNIKKINHKIRDKLQSEKGWLKHIFQKNESSDNFEKMEPASEKLAMVEPAPATSTTRKVLDLYQDRISISYETENQKSAPIKDSITHVCNLLGIDSPPYYMYKIPALALPYEALVQGLIQTFIDHDFVSFKDYMNHYIAHKIESHKPFLKGSLGMAEIIELFYYPENFSLAQKFWNGSLISMLIAHYREDNAEFFWYVFSTLGQNFNIPVEYKEEVYHLLDFALLYEKYDLAHTLIKDYGIKRETFQYRAEINYGIHALRFFTYEWKEYYTEKLIIDLFSLNLISPNYSVMVNKSHVLWSSMLLKHEYYIAFKHILEHSSDYARHKCLQDGWLTFLKHYHAGTHPEVTQLFTDNGFKLFYTDKSNLEVIAILREKTTEDRMALLQCFALYQGETFKLLTVDNLYGLIENQTTPVALEVSEVSSTENVSTETSPEPINSESVTEKIPVFQSWFNPKDYSPDKKHAAYFTEGNASKPLLVLKTETIWERLHEQFPHFRDVIEYYKGQFRFKQHKPTHRITPVLLLGEAGIGKTHFAQTMASLLNTGYGFIDMGNVTANWVLTGADGTWQDAKPGKIFELMKKSPTFNPIALLDEVDKGSTGHYNPMAPLYQLLEETNAKAVVDEYYNMPFNFSGIIYIACANELKNIPEPVVSRFKTFSIETPSEEQVKIITHQIYKGLIAGNNLFQQELSAEVLDLLSLHTPREIKVLVEGALSLTLSSMSEADFLQLEQEKEIMAIKPESLQKVMKKRTMGF